MTAAALAFRLQFAGGGHGLAGVGLAGRERIPHRQDRVAGHAFNDTTVPFDDIDRLISQDELRAISEHYKQVAGFSLRTPA